MDELANAKDDFLRLTDELVEEVFYRLPPSEPSHLVRASAVRKRWRRILADAGFRRRYRDFHGGAPPVMGLFQEDTTFVPTSALLPALPDHWRPRWKAMRAVDCRHGRALFTPYNRYFRDFGEGEPFDLTVLDPLTGSQHHVPCPDYDVLWFSAAVLCAAQGCDHHGCQGGDFRVAFVSTNQQKNITSGWLYSSETRKWSEFASVHHPNVTKYTFNQHVPSVLVGDAIYFNIDGVIKCDLGTLRLSMFERPTNAKGRLMTAEDGGLGFAAVMDVTNLTMWSMETGHERDMGWAKLKVIDLTMLLPDGALSVPAPECVITCIAEGSQVIFISTSACYMVDLKTGRVRKVAPPGRKFFPYMSFYMPAMEAASTGQGQ